MDRVKHQSFRQEIGSLHDAAVFGFNRQGFGLTGHYVIRTDGQFVIAAQLGTLFASPTVDCRGYRSGPAR